MPARTRLRDVLMGRDHVCPWWFIWTFDNPLRRMLHDPEAMLGGLLRPGDTAVDVGCGGGYFTVPLARLAAAPHLPLEPDDPLRPGRHPRPRRAAR